MPPDPKSYDPKILAYLKKSSNLPFVLQIGDYAAKIREDMPNEIWCDMVKELNESRPKIKLADGVKFDSPKRADLAKKILNLQPWKPGAKTGPKLFFDIEMNKSEDDFYIWIGAGWLSSQKKNSPIYRKPEVVNLRAAMENDPAGYEFSPPWWLCGRYTWPSTSRDKFVRECAKTKDGIVETTVTSFWRMVCQHTAQLNKANQQ